MKIKEKRQKLLIEIIDEAFNSIGCNWSDPEEVTRTTPYLEVIKLCQDVLYWINTNPDIEDQREALADKQYVKEWSDFLKNSNIEFKQIDDNLVHYSGICSGHDSDGFLVISCNYNKREKIAKAWSHNQHVAVSVGRLPTEEEWDDMYLEQTSTWNYYRNGELYDSGVVLSRYRYNNDWHNMDDLVWINCCTAGKEWLEPYHLRKE